MNIFETLLIEPLANGLIIFYNILWENLGLAIIGFSIFLKVALSPLTRPYMKSMKKIRDAQPQLDKLKKKFKGDKVKFAQAQADFYKEKGINPAAGCLPYLLQIVILIAFFGVFSRTISADGNLTENFNKLLYPPLQFSTDYVINTQFLHIDLTEPNTFSIPGIPFPLPGFLLIAAALMQLISAKIMAPYVAAEEKVAKKTKDTQDDLQVSMQKSTTYMFPLFTLIIGIQFSAGLALYWLVFSGVQAVEQYRSQGWGGLTPWLKKANLVKS